MKMLYFYLTLLTLLSLCTGGNSQACGAAPLNPQIIGGKEATPGAWPWHALLIVNGTILCGGSLISQQWVLTAASCHHNITMNKTVVALGVYNLTGPFENATVFNVTQVKTHPLYNSQGVFDHDIALLKLSSPVNFTNYIQPVCLAANTSSLTDGLSMWVAGWGQLSEGGPISNSLQEVCVPLVEDAKCSALFKLTVPPKSICAGFNTGGRGSCGGDGGGALVVKQGSAWVQVGIVSSGVGCGRPQAPGFYTEVPFFQEWIENIVDSADPPGFTNFTSPQDDSKYNCGFNATVVNPACGITFPTPETPNPQIVGGNDASPGAWPWQVYLVMNGSITCGGSLISKQWVMTAASCHHKVVMSQTQVYLGLHKLSGPYGRLVIRDVIQVVPHPSFNSGGQLDHDIALLKLSSPVPYTSFIRHVCLAGNDSTLKEELSLWATGWGRLTEDGSLSNTLQEVCVPLVEDTKCSSLFSFTIPTKTICAGFNRGGKGICQGDGGGPLVAKLGQVWVQVGIVSSTVGCARPNQPAFYTEVPFFQDWIEGIVGSADPPGFVNFTSPQDASKYNCGFNASAVNPACGAAPKNPKTPSPQISGGNEAAPGAWPWQAFVLMNETSLCGGSLISKEWVMTAASCHKNMLMSKTRVFLGVHNQTGPFDNVAGFTVIQVVFHPSYNSGGNHDHNIALLKLFFPAPYTDYIQPVCLAGQGSTLNNGLSMWATGWGQVTEGGSASNSLQEVCVPLVDDTKCQSFFSFTVPSKTICAGYDEGGKGPCLNDVGGPLVVRQGLVWVQVGIPSLSVGCAKPNQPALYTEVPDFQDWIENITGSAYPVGFVNFTSPQEGSRYNCGIVVTTTTPTTTNTTTTPATNTTTPPPTNTATTTVPLITGPIIITSLTMNLTFTPELNNPASGEFKNLAGKVVSAVTKTFKLNPAFQSALVSGFRQGSVIADVDIQFKPNSTVTVTDVVNTLTEAVKSNNSVFAGLGVDPGSISATEKTTTTTTVPPTTTTTTAPPTITTTAPPTITTTAPPTITTTTTARPSVSTTTTTTTTTASTDPPSISEGYLLFQCALNRVFTEALSNSTTAEYKDLDLRFRTELNRICRMFYGNYFSRTRVNSFRNGSVIVSSTLVFQNKTVTPCASTAQLQLANQLASSTALSVIPGSVVTDSSGRSLHGAALPMSVLTLLFLVITQILSDV